MAGFSSAALSTRQVPGAALEKQLLSVGGHATIRAVLEVFLRRRIVKQVLPEGINNLDEMDTKTAIVEAAKDFFTSIMASIGRRTDVSSNAFWAVASALLPPSLLKSRKGREAMRLLGIKNYRTLKKAGEIRSGLTAHGGWKLRTTSTHKDAVLWEPLTRWTHSAEASTEDNDNKTAARIYHVNPVTNEVY